MRGKQWPNLLRSPIKLVRGVAIKSRGRLSLRYMYMFPPSCLVAGMTLNAAATDEHARTTACASTLPPTSAAVSAQHAPHASSNLVAPNAQIARSKNSQQVVAASARG